MFTGIVERKGRVLRPGKRLAVETGWIDLRHGESVSVAGVCLTVSTLTDKAVEFDLVAETLKKTNLGKLHQGDRVNLERALRHGDRISGHLVQGHVEGTGIVTQTGGTLRIETELAAESRRSASRCRCLRRQPDDRRRRPGRVHGRADPDDPKAHDAGHGQKGSPGEPRAGPDDEASEEGVADHARVPA